MYVDEKNKKCKCPAPDYVNLVMSDCQKSIKDESVFPTKYGKLQLVISGITKEFKLLETAQVKEYTGQCRFNLRFGGILGCVVWDLDSFLKT